MLTEINGLLDRYIEWLRDTMQSRQLPDNSDYVEIATPHLDRHNDWLQFYVRKSGDEYLLTDGGYIIEDLEQSGCTLDTPKRSELLAVALAGFGVRNNDGDLETIATSDNFICRIHAFIQAMIAVDHLAYLARPNILNLFSEEVEIWLGQCDVTYMKNIMLDGNTGYAHKFDYAIPQSDKYPERFIQLVTTPNKETTQTAVFNWIDTNEARSEDAISFAFLNDNTGKYSGIEDAFLKYDIRPVWWSDRETVQEELVA